MNDFTIKTTYNCPNCGSAMGLGLDEKVVVGKNEKNGHIFICTNNDCQAKYDESALKVIQASHIPHEG